ncbi:hypothetical protein SLA2020_050550 [Shorea laevis]
MAVSIGTVVAEKVVENLVDRILNFILSPISVVRKCNENVQNLKNQVKALEQKKRSVERSREYVRRRGEDIDEEKDIDEAVETWLIKADKFIEAAGQSTGVDDEFAKNECFFRLCPNPLLRYKLSKKAAQFTGILQNMCRKLLHLPTLLLHNRTWLQLSKVLRSFPLEWLFWSRS